MGKVAKARAKARRRVWDLIAARAGGFPWLLVAGKLLTGWIVIDLDATLITASSDKQGAAVNLKKGYGFHPLGAWCANTTESLAMLLRPVTRRQWAAATGGGSVVSFTGPDFSPVCGRET